jgi:hypothetical protein
VNKSAMPAHAARTRPLVESKCSQCHEVLPRFAPAKALTPDRARSGDLFGRAEFIHTL